MAENNFLPHRRWDFRPGGPIQQGAGATDSHGGIFLGTKEIARNNNHLLDEAVHVVVAQVGEPVSTITYSASTITWAKYCIQVPAVRMKTNGNSVLVINVVATTTASRQFRVRGVTSAATGTFSGWTASAAEATAYVEATTGIDVTDSDGSADVFRVLQLDVELDGAGDFIPSAVYVYDAPADNSSAYAAEADAHKTDIAFQQNTTAWDTDSPLNVQSIREVIAANNYVYAHSYNTVAALTTWADYSTLTTADAGLFLISSASYTGTEPLMQLRYWPRQGVNKLRVSIAGRVDNWTTGKDGKVIVGFSNAEEKITATIATATTVFTAGSWAYWAGELPVPKGNVDNLVMTVFGSTVSEVGYNLWVQALSIIEVVERPPNGYELGGF